MKKYRGFTLIELLVVIAIIGVLSSVVLASLNTARSKGNDAGVKANLGAVATQAALYYSDNSNTYGTYDNGSGAAAACPTTANGDSVFGNATVVNAIAAALVDSSGGATLCLADNANYVVAVSRPADVATTTSVYWCTDSLGERCGIDAVTGVSCGTCKTRN